LQDAWDRGQELTVHGWVYALHDGLVRDMHISVSSPGDLLPNYERALARPVDSLVPPLA
jgi:carbonic anhydrase